uniref:BED-type domain-containing protein n=1 Tax=Octopus bimaculoides TaxID=37653 RepID=A0A0L8I895_OCTBM
MSAKKRKYLEYIGFRFVSLQKGVTEVHQCVICYKTLSNDGMRPSRLEHHLRIAHLALADNPKTFFETKRHSLKQFKLDGSGVFRQQISIVTEASYEIAMLIAKSKKSHNIGETLIKPSLLRAVELVLGKESANKLSQISLSNDTVKGSIDDLSQDNKDQILDQVRDSPVFAIQCDETTDTAQCSQLLVYVRFVSGECVKQEMFVLCQTTVYKRKRCSVTLSMTTAAVIFSDVSNFFQETNFYGIHCIKNVAIKVVIFVESGTLNSRLFKLLCNDIESEHEALLFHTNVRWLSKGNMLGQFYVLRKEITIFLDFQQETDLHDKFQPDGFQLSLAYLVDIFEALNALDLKLQGENINILTHHDTIRTSMAKLDLWNAMFGSTYLCAAAFSIVVAVKTKYRNRLNVERDIRCALSDIQPCMKDLVAKKQCQVYL